MKAMPISYPIGKHDNNNITIKSAVFVTVFAEIVYLFAVYGVPFVEEGQSP